MASGDDIVGGGCCMTIAIILLLIALEFGRMLPALGVVIGIPGLFFLFFRLWGLRMASRSRD